MRKRLMVAATVATALAGGAGAWAAHAAAQPQPYQVNLPRLCGCGPNVAPEVQSIPFAPVTVTP